MGRNAPPGFTEFVLSRGTELHRTALLLTHSTASAEDLVQTALVNLHRHLGPDALAHPAS